MSISRILAMIATLGPIGYFTAPGTVASIVAIPGMAWIHSLFPSEITYGAFCFIFCAVSIVIINKSLVHFKRLEDPSEIVLDEVVGCLFVFWGIPLTTESIIVGLILFRFFDILKIGGVGYVEKLVNAWGIVLDDVAAALISNIILRLIFSSM